MFRSSPRTILRPFYQYLINFFKVLFSYGICQDYLELNNSNIDQDIQPKLPAVCTVHINIKVARTPSENTPEEKNTKNKHCNC
jgi:hypothetical protein